MTKIKAQVAAGVFCVAAFSAALGAESQVLWQIGVPDGNNGEFALAPKDFTGLTEDGFFVVGQSDAKADWPYVHPGPKDAWAGGRSHTFTILFALRQPPSGANSRLAVDLVDTHASMPPVLRISINGKPFDRALPGGAGDATVHGEPGKGKHVRWEIPVPGGLLRPGENEIQFTTLSGSWLLYDSIQFETPPGTELGAVMARTILAGVRLPPVWLNQDSRAVQPVHLNVRHVGPDVAGTVQAGDFKEEVQLRSGTHTLTLHVPASEETRRVELRLTAGQSVVSTNVTLGPPGIREMWILPHSHVDIGYTHQQEEVVQAQIGHVRKALELAAASANNPEGMRFKWNPEAVWVVDHYLQRATPAERQRFIDAVRNGVIGVEALYGNMLTALCRPEELAQCLGFAARVSNLTGKPVSAATICDVPGYTWGMVPVMAQAGVRYFAIGPNFQDRVGTIHLWDDKPFYWQAQSGRERVLCWVVDNYHHLGDLEQNVLGQVERQARSGFPYDLSFLLWVGRWPSGAVDNAPPDEQLVEKVAAWNKKYAAPRVVIGLTGDFFERFERKHGQRLPQFAGDLTPYWEDGAGSTSRETAMNRASADRLSQASALFAMRQPQAYSPARFEEAWKNVLLYSEHTWGAWCSISKPDDSFTLDQWKTKQGFALEADKLSRELSAEALPTAGLASPEIEVVNTTQWERDDLAIVPAQLAGPAARGVIDHRGRTVSAQRLASGELAFLAEDVPAFGSRRFRLSEKPAPGLGKASVTGTVLENGILRVELDPKSGAIKSLRLAGVKQDFVDAGAPVGLNDFRYVLGEDAKGAQPNGPVTIRVMEAGPLVAALRVESGAPGCKSLVRDIRIVHGQDRVELINHVDRLSVREKDAVHFGFGFNVPDGTVRMETPWAVVRPNVDQLPGANRNWFTVQRWVDVSSRSLGITWAPLDAPLMELGGMTANLLGAVAYDRWLTNAMESPTIYSWAQNNHWHTNYKIDQPGVTTFRYIVRPHRGGYSAASAARFGHETSRPLMVGPGSGRGSSKSLVTVSSDGVLVETVKVSDDGRALVVRLFGASGKEETVRLKWQSLKPVSVWVSDLTEKPLRQVNRNIQIPPYGMVTLRAEL